MLLIHDTCGVMSSSLPLLVGIRASAGLGKDEGRWKEGERLKRVAERRYEGRKVLVPGFLRKDETQVAVPCHIQSWKRESRFLAI